MIVFWRNSTSDVTLRDMALSYSIGAVFLVLFFSSVLLNLTSLVYQCLNKATLSRRLFQLLALTDLVSSLYYPLYAAHMTFKPELIPQLASISRVEAMFLKLGSIPIYLSVVVTSLLSITRYTGVRDPLSVNRGSLERQFGTILVLMGCYTGAIVVVLVYSLLKIQTGLYRGAGLTVYFWEAGVLAEGGSSATQYDLIRQLTVVNLILWVPAQVHCVVGFVMSFRTILLLRDSKRNKVRVNAPLSPRQSPSARVFKNTVKLKMITSPTLDRYLRNSPLASAKSSTNLTASLLNNRRGAVTIFLMNIGNVVWFINFLSVIFIEVKRDYFGFTFLDSARFIGRLFVPQILALLNPLIVTTRSSGLQTSAVYYRTVLGIRLRRRVRKLRRHWCNVLRSLKKLC